MCSLLFLRWGPPFSTDAFKDNVVIRKPLQSWTVSLLKVGRITLLMSTLRRSNGFPAFLSPCQ